MRARWVNHSEPNWTEFQLVMHRAIVERGVFMITRLRTPPTAS